MTDANGLLGDYHTRVIIPRIESGPLSGDYGWIAAAEACTEVGADDGFGAIEGALSWPALLSAAVVVLAMLSAIFWPY